MVNKRQRASTDAMVGSTYWWSWSGGTLVTVKHIFGSQAQVIHSKGVALVYTSELRIPTQDDLTAAGAKATPVTVKPATPARRGKRPAVENVPTPQVAERTKRHREMEQSIRESAERMCKSNADILDYPDIKRNMQATDLYAEAVAAHEALEVVVWNAVPANLDELDAVMQRADVAMNAMTDRAFEIQRQQNAAARGRPILPFEGV